MTPFVSTRALVFRSPRRSATTVKRCTSWKRTMSSSSSYSPFRPRGGRRSEFRFGRGTGACPLGASSSERRVRKARPRWRRAFMSRTPTVTPRFRPARACLTSMVYTARFTSTRPASSASKCRRARCVSRQATVFRQRPSHGRYRSSRARWHWWIYRSSFCGNRARTAGTPQTTTTI